MPSFRLPAWRQTQINKKFARKNKVIARTVNAMEAFMYQIIDTIIDDGMLTGHFRQPSINGAYEVTDRFYRSVIEEAFYACQEEKEAQIGKKRLAKGPVGIPRKIKKLNDIFGNSIYWQRIMRRSKKLTERLLKAYLRKLRIKFDDVMPLIREGKISPADAKKYMKEEWKAKKPRVETIFRTETTNYFGKTQVEFFKDSEDIIGFLFDSIRDTSRTDICRSRHGMIYRRDHSGKESIAYNTPALHYNCRSHLIPLVNSEENRRMIEDVSRDPAKNKSKIKPLDPKWRR